jgi:hypothetical protein
VNDVEIAWAAGLFEGEGCFTVQRQRQYPPYVYVYPQASLGMTDEDMVRRFHAIVGVGNVSPMIVDKRGYKPMWRWQAYGEPVLGVIEMLGPYLGQRRRERALELLGL